MIKFLLSILLLFFCENPKLQNACTCIIVLFTGKKVMIKKERKRNKHHHQKRFQKGIQKRSKTSTKWKVQGKLLLTKRFGSFSWVNFSFVKRGFQYDYMAENLSKIILHPLSVLVWSVSCQISSHLNSLLLYKLWTILK